MAKILIIDDEESIVNLLSLSLKSDGHDVAVAYNGDDAVKVFQWESPDIVLTDLMMPGIDGIEVLKKIKEINPDAEIIIITGHGDMDSAIEALKFGASDFINKPIRDDALSVALDRAKEKIDIKQKLKEYTRDLEHMVTIATEEVRAKSEFQAKLISSSTEGIIALDEQNRIVIYNPGAERIFGYSHLEVAGNMKAEHLCGLQLEKNIKEVEPPSWREVTVTAKSGERVPVRVFSNILYEKGNPIGCVTFFQDLREIKNLEKELLKNERLAAIGQTIAGLAHYIKNILTGLKGGSYVANIGYDRKDLEKLGTGWQMIQTNIKRISDLVMNLLKYSKEREPEYCACNPNDILKEVTELMELRAKEYAIRITTTLDASIEEVLLDQETLHHALLNIVSNAIDACIFDDDNSKHYVVEIESFRESDTMIGFEIKDNGCGMNDEVKEKLFSSFYSTKKGKGTGLGLLVTKKLIEEHGGDIKFTSECRMGSTFIIRLACKSLR